MINSARYLKSHELCNGRLGATGFCWGGGMTNRLAVALGSDLDAGVPFYGAAAASEDASKIEAALMIIYAGTESAHQCDVARIRGGASGEWRDVRDAHVRGYASRLPQQFNASLQ